VRAARPESRIVSLTLERDEILCVVGESGSAGTFRAAKNPGT